MKIVSNAGPLIALGKLGQLNLLLKFNADISISHGVYNEVVVKGLQLGMPDAKAVSFLIRQKHIRVTQVTLPAILPIWAQPLDIGEIETIFLAQKANVDWVLIDNLHARKAAQKVGLPLKGTVGLLLQAYRRDHLSQSELELIFQQIKSDPTLWISESLCDKALSQIRSETTKK